MNREKRLNEDRKANALAQKKEEIARFLKKHTAGLRLFYIGLSLCLFVLAYAFFDLYTLGEYGSYHQLTLRVGALIEHALLLLLMGFGGCLLFDLLDRWEKRADDK